MSIPGLKLPLSYDGLSYALVGNCYVKWQHGYRQTPDTYLVLDKGGGHPHDPDNDCGNPFLGQFTTEEEARRFALTHYSTWLNEQLREIAVHAMGVDNVES